MLLSARVFGVMLWLWFMLFFSFFGLLGLVLYYRREWIRKKYYTIRFPEKVIRVIIHYKTGLYKVYYRLIPDRDLFTIDRKPYYYDKDVIGKQDDFFIKKGTEKEEPKLLIVKNLFVKQKGDKELIHIGETEEYDYKEEFKIKGKHEKYAEIHYLYNCPYPLNFDLSTEKLEFSSINLKEFKDNDLVSKLLSLKEERMLLMLILILVAVNMFATIFLISKTMGWIE